MNLMLYKKALLSKQAVLAWKSAFLEAFGLCAIVLGILDILFPGKFNSGLEGLGVIGTFSVFWGVLRIIPRRTISRELGVPDTKITIKTGDIFREDGNVVIGMNDVFDTASGELIKPTSIQGQLLSKVYKDDCGQLDKDLCAALEGASGVKDSGKTKGKNVRYPIGTVAVIPHNGRRYFCSAYSRMGDDKNLRTQSDIGKLSASLDALWEQVRLKGQGEPVVMAVLGSDLARIGNTASQSNLIKQIVSSFILSSRDKWITRELRIIIHPPNIGKINMLELDNFLQCF